MNARMFFKTIFPGLFLITMAFTFPNQTQLEGTFKVDVSASKVNWKGYKVTGTHEGTVNVRKGELQFKQGVLTGGSFEVDMTSITCSDMQGEYATKLINHLKSEDFFNAAKHPTAKFEITKAVAYGTTSGNYKITGNLTIKEATKPLKFNAIVTQNAGQLAAEAKIIVDRSEFDVQYGSGSFFESLGDKTIYDEFDLNVKLVAKK